MIPDEMLEAVNRHMQNVLRQFEAMDPQQVNEANEQMATMMRQMQMSIGPAFPFPPPGFLIGRPASSRPQFDPGASAPVAEASAPAARPTPVPPACRLPQEAAAENGDCAICLEALRGGQSCRRTPCLHAFHDVCLSEWLHQSPTCPVCMLNLAVPARELRYRLQDLAGLAASELKYLAGYLGIIVERGVERSDLELMILSSTRVRVVCRRQELSALPVQRLRALLASAGVRQTAGLAEKADLVGALLASGRYKEECASPVAQPSLDVATPTGPSRVERPSRAQRAGPY
mmetsp:Transcript_24168/g.54640  ORF Transcript_24168/g.54640 Transcript_24168/m.54640 type:complete len:289 (+) Transcript_24168:86-952(+)